MGAMTLDDSLHAVVQLTHEHGLPVRAVYVAAGSVMVHCSLADMPCWIEYLTSADNYNLVAQHSDTSFAIILKAVRDGIEWTVCQNIPTTVADPILTQHHVATLNWDLIEPAVVLAITHHAANAEQDR